MVTTSSDTRVTLQPAYVLHQRPYSDTSALVEIFSRDFGRLSLIAKGARQMRSPLRSILSPFQCLSISWSGKGEVKSLTQAEVEGQAKHLTGDRMLSGLYVNELLLRLLPRYDAHDTLFDYYRQFLHELEVDPAIERPLRRFENRLLSELGYELLLTSEADRTTAVESGARYRYVLEHGPVRTEEIDGASTTFSGKSLLALATDDLSDADVLLDVKKLLRAALNRCLGDKPLKTRELMRALHSRSAETERGS